MATQNMSTSLRDQLLKAGLINKKQVNDAERQLQRQERQKPERGPNAKPRDRAVVPQPAASTGAQRAKAARDQELNRQQRDKAEKKARLAQIKQLVEQNRLPPIESAESFNFLDGAKIRRIAVDAAARERLGRGELAIVRHGGGYDLIPAAIAARIRERDAHAVIPAATASDSPPVDAAYEKFTVPDDLMW
jgi:uncharacterized protein YaiL (DUF2058 family)